ncbi:MAG: DUF4843 domain-containing protein [Oscillibacter sp.]|nr:DUF4843 domain-containing protein [Oscillibacter sp.]
MKYIFFIALSFCLLGCEEDQLKFYHGVDNIYFCRRNVSSSQMYVDTTVFSFAFADAPDTLIQLSVRGQGEMRDFDRPFRVAVEGGTAQAGVNFDALEDFYVLEANNVYGTVPVRIYREGLKEKSVSMVIRLLPNEYFVQNMPYTTVKYDTVDITRHVLVFTNQLKQPDAWSEAYLGYFSEAKFRLVNEELGIAAASWYDESRLVEMSNKAKGAGVYMVNYLNEFVKNNDYVNMPKDPDAPAENRGYMTFKNSTSGTAVKIPAEWPDATE